jgi:GxxExxY protein
MCVMRLSGRVIGLAIEVHRQLSPGPLESAYEECLCFESAEAGIEFARRIPLSLTYKTVRLDCGYRMDVVVADRLIVESKTVERIMPIHKAQLLTYLRLSGHRVGLLLNFNTVVLKDDIRWLVL